MVGRQGPDEDAKTIPAMSRARPGDPESSPTVTNGPAPSRSIEDAHPTLDTPMAPYSDRGTYPGTGSVPQSERPTDQQDQSGIPRLVVVGRDGEEGEVFPLRGDTVTIGRREGDLTFPEDSFMSTIHARVERVGDAYTLVDLGSPNGVYKRIRGTSPAFPGDLFMVGHQVLRLENIVESVEEQPTAADGTRLFGTPLKPAWGKLSLVGRGGVPGDTYFLRGAKVVFGREQGDILFPADPFVSREHARLRLEIQGASMSVFLEDLGSANGTYIRIRGSSELRARDTFRIGDQILRLRLDR
jgi:pSer/pThr/pTyr-binding forkhead associated (FHA) protein